MMRKIVPCAAIWLLLPLPASAFVLDGVHDDGPDFSAARRRAVLGERIAIPAGGDFHPISPITGGPTFVWWDASGPLLNAGAPVAAIGNDLVSQIFQGTTRFWSRRDTRPDLEAVFRVDRHFSYGGGIRGDVVPAMSINCSVDPLAIENFPWCARTTLISSGRGGDAVAMAAVAVRPSDALADRMGPRSELWGGYLEARDRTKAADSAVSGSMVGLEVDLFGNGTDRQKHRILLQGVVSRDAVGADRGQPFRVGKGFTIDSGDADGTGAVGQAYSLTAPFFVAGFDASDAKAQDGAPAFRMAMGQSFCLTAANDRCMAYDRAGWSYLVGRALPRQVFSVEDSGRVASSFRFHAPLHTPSASSEACEAGDSFDDATYHYVCVARNHLRRTRLEDF